MTEYYTANLTLPSQVTVHKFVDFEVFPQSTYYVERLRNRRTLVCDCPGFGRGGSTCRHISIVQRFNAEQKMNAGWYYLYDQDAFGRLFGIEDWFFEEGP